MWSAIAVCHESKRFAMKTRIALRYGVLIVIPLLLALAASELLLRVFLGLGNPVLYDNSPIYGFRPVPNRTYNRFYGARLEFNNLGLRADSDWNGNAGDKVLFLGDSVTYGGSIIGNRDLFSAIAVKIINANRRTAYIAGDAGVNAWGVENIHALVMESRFTPAGVYVTTLVEDDFYRGLTRIQGLPYFNKTPHLALLEAWYYFCYLQNNQRYVAWAFAAKPDLTKYVVDKAVRELKEMDAALKAKGWISLIFISPLKSEVLGQTVRNRLVEERLRANGVQVNWILDEVIKYSLSDDDKNRLFVDHEHLSRAGHKLWGAIIAKDLERSIATIARPAS
jgi:hypothetical protein